MPWTEFCSLLSGLMPDTPLGQIVTIRSEKDKKVIKAFTPDQRQIHKEWRKRLAKKKLENPAQLDKDMEAITKAFAVMFGRKEVSS